MPITIETEIDSGNVDAALTVITDADALAPTVQVRTHGSWRHFLFRVDSAAGKQPTFRVDRTNITTVGVSSSWRPLWTVDFETWNAFPSFSVDGDYYVFTDSAAFTDDSVYIASQPTFRVADSHTLAAALLVAPEGSPANSADALGVIGTSPLETGNYGRQVGGHSIYGIKLDWGGSTTDGGRKRNAVLTCGIHSGEPIDGYGMQGFLDWAMNDPSEEAQAFRSNFILHCYFNLTPNGRYGGAERTNFRSAQDPNRDWIDGEWVLQETMIVRDAILNDIDAPEWDMSVAFHAWPIAHEFLYYYTNQASLTIESSYRSHFTSFESTVNNRTFAELPTGTFGEWAVSQGATFTIAAEFNQRGVSDPDRYKQIGAYHARALQMLDAENAFSIDSHPAIDRTFAPQWLRLSVGRKALGVGISASGSTLTLSPGINIHAP